jgi:hypothetical protein
MPKKPRKKVGTNVAIAKPFAIFPGKRGGVGVRIGTSKPFFTATEVSLNAGLSIITRDGDGNLRIEGEGVVRRHGTTIAITP